LFEYQELGPLPLKGFAGSIGAWRVVGESGLASRFEALRSRQTPLVGREAESALLRQRWEQAVGGDGRAVMLMGEAGIGKSRLIAVLEEQIAGTPHVTMGYFCSPHHSDSALYPLINQIERAAKFERDDTPEQKLGKLEGVVVAVASAEDAVLLMAGLLSLPTAGRYPASDLSPSKRKERLFETLLSHLETQAKQAPLLIVFEDVHWIDPT